MNNIDKIAEAMSVELVGDRIGTVTATPAVVLRTLDRMGYRAHKYPAPDRPGVVGPDDPQWSLDVGTLQLDLDTLGAGLFLDGRSLIGEGGHATLDEYQQLAEGILAAVELARTIIDPESED